tara:strand:- start:1271 stop:1534 length:264 start_codon:yes stop_codon:yes gene_type:complete
MSVNRKIKKGSITKSDKDIEVSIGEDSPSKYQIMKAIAKKYTVYGATVWLNNPIPEQQGKTPAELMMQGDLKIVSELIEKSNGKSGT